MISKVTTLDIEKREILGQSRLQMVPYSAPVVTSHQIPHFRDRVDRSDSRHLHPPSDILNRLPPFIEWWGDLAWKDPATQGWGRAIEDLIEDPSIQLSAVTSRLIGEPGPADGNGAVIETSLPQFESVGGEEVVVVEESYETAPSGFKTYIASDGGTPVSAIVDQLDSIIGWDSSGIIDSVVDHDQLEVTDGLGEDGVDGALQQGGAVTRWKNHAE